MLTTTAAAHAAPPEVSGIPAAESKFVETKGGQRVIYDNDVTEAEAQSLSDALIRVGFFRGTQTSHVLLRGNAKRGRAVSFITHDGAWQDPTMIGSFRFISDVLEARLFRNQNLRVHLCSAEIVCHLTIVPQARLGVWAQSKNRNDVFYKSTNPAQNGDALDETTAEIGRVISDWTDSNGLKGGLMMVTEDEHGRVSFCVGVTNPKFATDARFLKELKTPAKLLSLSAFNERPVRTYVCDTTLAPIR